MIGDIILYSCFLTYNFRDDEKIGHKYLYYTYEIQYTLKIYSTNPK
ncbi:hypothetical protein HZS_4597 [Henneguya salminicola]|nr:hypothetical protein HZS_4597 [Henneguya salminicola]